MGASAAGIKAITGSLVDDAVLAPFVVAADCVIAELAARGCLDGKTQDCIDSASNFLGAHFFTSSKVGKDSAIAVEEEFENYRVKLKRGGNNGTGILSSDYGQTANVLLGGCLANLDKPRATVGFF